MKELIKIATVEAHSKASANKIKRILQNSGFMVVADEVNGSHYELDIIEEIGIEETR